MEGHEGGEICFNTAVTAQVQSSEGPGKGGGCENGGKRVRVVIKENSVGLCERRLTEN